MQRHSHVRNKLKTILCLAVIVFIGLQFFNPPRVNPPVKNDFIAGIKPPSPIASTLRAACYDCHSHETVWPFYSCVAPVSWLVAADVSGGRERLNFSDWPKDPELAAKKLDRIYETLDYREMPPGKYTIIHAAARLAESSRKELMEWAEAESRRLNPPSLDK